MAQTKQDFEKGEMNSLRNMMWTTPGIHWEPIEPSKDWIGYVLYDVNEEVFEIKQNKNNKKEIVLTVGGEQKNWSSDTLLTLFEDVLVAYDSQKKLRKTLKATTKEINTQKQNKPKDESVITAQILEHKTRAI